MAETLQDLLELSHFLGAEERKLAVLDEVHRFPNNATRGQGALRWNALRIFEELKNGLRKVAARKMPIVGLSTDSWVSTTCCSRIDSRCLFHRISTEM